MLSQEFALPDVLRIWDSLLSDETRSDFLIDVCTAMVLVIRDDILTNDFAENMKLLQVNLWIYKSGQAIFKYSSYTVYLGTGCF